MTVGLQELTHLHHTMLDSGFLVPPVAGTERADGNYSYWAEFRDMSALGHCLQSRGLSPSVDGVPCQAGGVEFQPGSIPLPVGSPNPFGTRPSLPGRQTVAA